MTKTFAATAALALSLTVVVPAAFAQTPAPTTAAAPAPAAAPAKTLSVDSTVKELLDDARTKAILAKHVPLIVEHAPQYPEILPMTFRALAAMSEAQTMAGLTADVLKKIETDIAAP